MYPTEAPAARGERAHGLAQTGRPGAVTKPTRPAEQPEPKQRSATARVPEGNTDTQVLKKIRFILQIRIKYAQTRKDLPKRYKLSNSARAY